MCGASQPEALRSRVIEHNHIVLLNWSDKTVPMLHELCNANESEGGGTLIRITG
jgi:hypothetical protein